MRALLLFSVLCIGLLFSNGLKGQIGYLPADAYLIKGFVVGADTSQTIPLANILNKQTQDRFVSNRFGAFGIPVSENDTLVFTVIGYQTYELPVKKYVISKHQFPIKVRLKPLTYQLKQIDVSYRKKRQDSLAKQAAILLKKSPLLNNYQHVHSWMKGNSGTPLNDMLSAGNSKMQEYTKLMHLIELYQEQQKVDERLTDDLICRATGLKPNQVQAYKQFCKLPHYFILNASDYELIVAIKDCYKDFKLLKK
jgi:hypothetical protein